MTPKTTSRRIEGCKGKQRVEDRNGVEKMAVGRIRSKTEYETTTTSRTYGVGTRRGKTGVRNWKRYDGGDRQNEERKGVDEGEGERGASTGKRNVKWSERQEVSLSGGQRSKGVRRSRMAASSTEFSSRAVEVQEEEVHRRMGTRQGIRVKEGQRWRRREVRICETGTRKPWCHASGRYGSKYRDSAVASVHGIRVRRGNENGTGKQRWRRRRTDRKDSGGKIEDEDTVEEKGHCQERAEGFEETEAARRKVRLKLGVSWREKEQEMRVKGSLGAALDASRMIGPGWRRGKKGRENGSENEKHAPQAQIDSDGQVEVTQAQSQKIQGQLLVEHKHRRRDCERNDVSHFCCRFASSSRPRLALSQGFCTEVSWNPVQILISDLHYFQRTVDGREWKQHVEGAMSLVLSSPMVNEDGFGESGAGAGQDDVDKDAWEHICQHVDRVHTLAAYPLPTLRLRFFRLNRLCYIRHVSPDDSLQLRVESNKILLITIESSDVAPQNDLLGKMGVRLPTSKYMETKGVLFFLLLHWRWRFRLFIVSRNHTNTQPDVVRGAQPVKNCHIVPRIELRNVKNSGFDSPSGCKTVIYDIFLFFFSFPYHSISVQLRLA
ncbi:hypothetical protein R3P38DRAFT_3357065 [Favolaschia claudopus]|uniref:Uncharacterized protein n=1 Tax=Favolaschia claudopus TaxID=2862362 RepID=A0AAW0BDH3_9AGAR